MAKALVIYHDKCIDGLTSALIAKRNLPPDTEFHAAKYGSDLPDVAGKDVYILDFSYPAAQTIEIADKAAGLIVLDHHKTAQEAMEEARGVLQNRTNVLIDFDMESSGAGLTAKHFKEPDNWFVNYVEDRDLWRFKLPNSKNVNAYIQSIPLTFEAYEAASQSVDVDQANVLGMGALKYLETYAQDTAAQHRIIYFDGYENIPVVNAAKPGISEILNILAKKFTFALGWFQRPDAKVEFSLRSVGDFDVSAIAKTHGGGGHKNASGFTTTLEEAVKLIK